MIFQTSKKKELKKFSPFFSPKNQTTESKFLSCVSDTCSFFFLVFFSFFGGGVGADTSKVGCLQRRGTVTSIFHPILFFWGGSRGGDMWGGGVDNP